MPTVAVEVVGEGSRTVDLAAAATYGDLLAALEFSPHEAAVLVDGAAVGIRREQARHTPTYRRYTPKRFVFPTHTRSRVIG